MKPIIGIGTNHSLDDQIGRRTGLGMIGQEWQLLADDYVIAIERAGGIPLVLPLTRNPETSFRLLSVVDGVMFTGGSDIDPQLYGEYPKYGLKGLNPRRDQHELTLMNEVLDNTELPVLGICRGMQLLTVATGGSLYQDLRLERPDGINHTTLDVPPFHATHPVFVDEPSLFHEIFGQREFGVNNFNHQAVKEVGSGFRATVTAPDGLIEGIERDGERFVAGVQWHPETLIDHQPVNLKLFTAFVAACAQSRDLRH